MTSLCLSRPPYVVRDHTAPSLGPSRTLVGILLLCDIAQSPSSVPFPLYRALSSQQPLVSEPPRLVHGRLACS